MPMPLWLKKIKDDAKNSVGKIFQGIKKPRGWKHTLSETTGSFRESASQKWTLLKTHFPRNMEDLKKIRPQEVIEKLQTVSKGNVGLYMRLGAATLMAYFLADTAALFTDSFIPDPPLIPSLPFSSKKENRRSPDEYAEILRRNIFNSRGIIPNDATNADPNGPARRTNLPFNLVGTVVLRKPEYSIAAIEDKAQNMIFPVRINDSIANKALIKKIEHFRVTFINTTSGVLEYVEIPEDQINNAISIQPSAVSKGQTAPIEKEGDNHYNIQRTELDKAFGNFNEVLTQARAIPNFENGMPNGYKIIQIVPNSIYTKLGINEGDVITHVNGEPMNDPGKAFALMNELRSGNPHIELTLKGADGRPRNVNYDVK